MRPWSLASCSLILFASCCLAAEVRLDQRPQNQQQCSGMYSRKAWGGSVDPFILNRFLPYKPAGDGAEIDDPVVAVVLFEWKDEHLLGRPKSPDNPEKLYICDAEAVQLDLCTSDTFGEYLLAPNATEASRNKIITQAVRPKSPERQAINYAIVRTGYYCIITTGLGDFPYTAVVEFRNAYGELSGAQIAKLPFYGGITVVYAVIGFLWAFLYVQRRNDILPVQNYITATIAVLVVEMAMTWAYYDYQNRNGATTGSRVLMLMVSVLNAARNSFSFFLLLIVCMGYGVVKPTLGKTMVYVRWLTAAHFTFGVLYATASLSVAPEDAGPLMLLVVGPLAGTLTAFYVWTLNSLGATMRDLTARKQTVKASMYRKLWYCIIASILVIFAFFFLNSFTLAGQGDPDFTPNNWQTRWFVLDGWLNLVYLFDVCFIAYLWRPTANNRRFAMSDEIAQDDDGFEIASVRDSLDDLDAEELGTDRPADMRHGGYTASAPNGRAAGGKPTSPGGGVGGRESPLPAPQPQRPPRPRRDSADGETIFAVGDDDDDNRFSDSGDEDAEKAAPHAAAMMAPRKGGKGKDD